MQNKLTLGSLFDGSGGFPLGGLLSGIVPIWASEIEPFAIRVTTKRLPFMKHYGDVSKLNGAELPPVDIITFGSPCQDMSIAGKREGLSGSRSNLFYEAIRIIKEMRCATNGRYPKYCVWENVPGAFSSGKGEDFRCVLESLAKIKDSDVCISRCEKWEKAGYIVGNGYSIAWRVLDAQHWGVPQRRKRIFLVADFDGECAGKILFESESVSGYTAEGFKAWQRTAAVVEKGTGKTSELCLNDQGGDVMNVTHGVTATLRAESNHPPIVFENHSQDTRYTQLYEVAPTVASTYGTGGNNQPFVVNEKRCFDVRFTSEGTKEVRHNCYETSTSRTIDTSGNPPDGNQGGVAVVSVEKSNSVPIVYSTSKNSHHTRADENIVNTLVASDYKDPPTVAEFPVYVVRRLTPKECARLQGFPDWWCGNLGTDIPNAEELEFWRQVFETYRKTVGTSNKPKSDKQILKWLKNPHSDSAEYKLWGNGVALPCVWFVLAGIVYYSRKSPRRLQSKVVEYNESE